MKLWWCVRTKVTTPTVDPTACLLATQKADPPTDNKIVDCNAIHLARMATNIKQNLYIVHSLSSSEPISRITIYKWTRYTFSVFMNSKNIGGMELYIWTLLEHLLTVYRWTRAIYSSVYYVLLGFPGLCPESELNCRTNCTPLSSLSRVAILKQNSKHEWEV